ncbi:response regulator [Thermodesulfobacteriota bacterium]
MELPPIVGEEKKPSRKRNKQLSFRILLIDDAVPLVKLFQEGLSCLGHIVFGAASAEDGIRFWEQNDLDVIVCDLDMPDMDGWQVARAIKTLSHERGIRKVPFVMVTGWGCEIGEDYDTFETGVDAIATKPLELPSLVELSRNLLERVDQKSM